MTFCPCVDHWSAWNRKSLSSPNSSCNLLLFFLFISLIVSSQRIECRLDHYIVGIVSSTPSAKIRLYYGNFEFLTIFTIFLEKQEEHRVNLYLNIYISFSTKNYVSAVSLLRLQVHEIFLGFNIPATYQQHFLSEFDIKFMINMSISYSHLFQ